MWKLNIFALLCILCNLLFLAIVNLLFYDKLVISWQVDKNLLFFAIISILISLGLISVLLSKILNLNLFKTILNMIISVSVGFFGLNIKNICKAIYRIANFDDEIYTCLFFKMYYIYNKDELLFLITKSHSQLWKTNMPLTLADQLKILDNATTATEVKANIEAYCHYEATAYWPQIKNLLTTSMNFLLDHPILLIGMGVGVTAALAYLGYNVYKLREEIKEINKCTDLGYVKNQVKLSEHSIEELEKNIYETVWEISHEVGQNTNNIRSLFQDISKINYQETNAKIEEIFWVLINNEDKIKQIYNILEKIIKLSSLFAGSHFLYLDQTRPEFDNKPLLHNQLKIVIRQLRELLASLKPNQNDNE